MSCEVSVVMITYGHELYIEEAILGVLMQCFVGNFDLIIANDCSPDNTEELVQSIAKNHPKGHLIKYFRHNENKGIANNFAWALEQCKGRYIAICEGDDFWIDNYKLQKQFEILELNSGLAMCSHATNEVDKDSAIFKVAKRSEDIIDIRMVLEQGWFIRTPSMFFRKEVIDEGFPSFYYSAYSTDYILQIMILKTGKCRYLPDVMAAYRSHPRGVSNTTLPIQLHRWVAKGILLEELNCYTNHKFELEINAQKKLLRRNTSYNLIRFPTLISKLGIRFYIENFQPFLALKAVFYKTVLKLKSS